MQSLFTRFAGWCAWATGHPLAFIVASASCVLWAVTGPLFHYSDTWQLVINTGTTVLTFLMVFVLQHSQNRDSIAIQAKLDELIMHTKDARNDLIEAEKLTEEEVELLRQHRAESGASAATTRKLNGKEPISAVS
jgi:low affinity Fe/Cu permease